MIRFTEESVRPPFHGPGFPSGPVRFAGSKNPTSENLFCRFHGPVCRSGRPAVRLKIQQCWIFSAPDCGWPHGDSPMTSHNGVFPLAARVNDLLTSPIIPLTYIIG